MKERDLIQAGRQRKWVRARSMLVYLGCDWGRASVKEIGQRFASRFIAVLISLVSNKSALIFLRIWTILESF